MADKPLKSITFPGLSDRYTIDSDVFIVRTTSGAPTADSTGNLYYPTDKTADEAISAAREGKQVILIHDFASQYDPSIYYITYSSTSNIGLTCIHFSINASGVRNLEIRSAIFNSHGVRFTILSNGSQVNLTGSSRLNYSLPSGSGQPGQVAVLDSSGSTYMIWADLPTLPTIDTSIDSSSVNTEVASAKAVYDFVQSAIGDAIGGAY